MSAGGHTQHTDSSKNIAVSFCICDTNDSSLPVTVELQQVEAKVIQWPFVTLLLLFFFQVIHPYVRRQRGAGILPVLTEALERTWLISGGISGFPCHRDGHATHLESILIFGEGVGH